MGIGDYNPENERVLEIGATIVSWVFVIAFIVIVLVYI